mmetsp:Transcript_18247/g.29981  ORF Transcript_18247/g.29981 Transcript_18247/m.29981 type:complete len:167 (-) Transcript_18247:106-606(-)
MWAKMEHPEPVKASWERHSISLDTSQEQVDISAVWKFIMQAWQEKVPPVISAEEKAEREESHARNAESIIHHVDVCLRRLVSTYMQMLSSDCSDSESHSMAQRHDSALYRSITKLGRKAAAETLNNIRQGILRALRKGTCPLELNSADDIMETEVERLMQTYAQPT